MKCPIALLAAILLPSCNTRPATSIHVDGAFEPYIPANTIFLAGGDIDKIRDTPVFQRVIAAAAGPQLNNFIRETGIDPRKDLARFVSFSSGEDAVLLARGSLSETDLSSKLEAHGLKRASYKGANLYADDTNAAVFIDAFTVAAGRTPAIHSMLDTYDPARRLSSVLGLQLQSIPADSEIWAVFTGGLHGLRNGASNSNLANFVQVLQGITGGALGVDLSNGLSLSARVTCHTNEDARRVHDAARGLIGMGRLSTPDNQPDLLKVFDAIQVEQKESVVNISARLSQDLTDKFLDIWLKKRA